MIVAKLMTNTEFVKRLQDIADNYDTVYAYGVFGAPLTASILSAKQKQYSWFYTPTKMAELNKRLGAFGFDCVNLVKGLLWGWNGDKSKTYGGAVYATNGVPDTNANGMMANYCTNQSTDFSNILIGEALWLDGHFGVYIGSGKSIECTPSWKNKVQVTAVSKMGAISGLPSQSWVKHGKLPWIDYTGSNGTVNNGGTASAINDGDTVTIKADAVYGGLTTDRGKAVPPPYIGQKYTVKKQQKNNGVQEALLQGINSWVAVAYLTKG